MPRPTAWLAGLAAALLAAASVALVRDHTRLDSPTMDEPYHAEAAAEYAILGTYWANLEHPPLTKLLAGASMKAAGVRAPVIPVPFDPALAEKPFRFVYENSVSPAELLAAGRAPFLGLLVLLVLASAAMAGSRGGPLAAVAAAAFVAFEPNVVAHAGVIHTDVAASLGFLVTVWAALAALERRSFLLWAATGVALGLTISAKFSGAFLVPVLVVLVALRVLLDGGAWTRARLAPLLGLALAGVVALGALLSVYAVAMRSMSRDDAQAAEAYHLLGRGAGPATIQRVQAVAAVCPPLGHYLAGTVGVALQSEKGAGINYLMGETRLGGFPGYFLVAFLVKSSLGLLALAGVAAAMLPRLRGRVGFGAVALAVTIAGLFAATLSTTYNIGLRHVLPVYPLLAVGASIAVARALPPRRAAAVLAGLAALQAAETLAVHPHELSFFNLASGGPANGSRWLTDSNLDWGQDLLRLQLELERRGETGPVTVVYFGGGLPRHYLPRARSFDEGLTTFPPGLYAISSFLHTAGPDYIQSLTPTRPERAEVYRQLLEVLRSRGTPEGRVGYSILLFRVR